MEHGFNFFRKIWHILGLFIPTILYLDVFQGSYDLVYATRAILVVFLGVFLALLLLLETVRLNHGGFEAFFFKSFGFLMKESERRRLNGTVPYFLANFLVVLVFPPEIAMLAVLFLVIGDPIAAYVGGKYGRRRFSNGKSWEGVFGFLVGAFFGALLLLIAISYSRPESFLSLHLPDNTYNFKPILVISIGVILSCLTEFFSGTTAKGLIDDNLLIPIVGAVSLSVASYLFLDYVPMNFFVPPTDLFLQK